IAAAVASAVRFGNLACSRQARAVHDVACGRNMMAAPVTLRRRVPGPPSGIARMTKATWYFDFVSPFSYLQLARFGDLPGDLEVAMKPILFSALLEHWEHKGPAEISTKRRFVYRFFRWQAGRRGIPF